MKTDRDYILRCLELAKNGSFEALPNPSVGAVIVYKGQIIGEGYTSKYGGNHAEVNAIRSVKNQEELIHSTIYVSLEPCSHFGKTPPCCDLIIEKKIPKVVIGTIDPFAQVCGQGIERMRKAGIEVIVGVLEKECRESNKRFFCFHQKKRPYIILKWAESEDGFIAPINRNKIEPVWLTNKYSQQLVHKWRSEESAFLVGTKTVLDDNPSLTNRDWHGKNPTRIFIDKTGKIDNTYSLKDNSTKTICITENNILESKPYLIYEKADFSLPLPPQICKILHKHSISSVVIEGGTKTLQSFIDSNLWDEARIFKSTVILEKGISSPKISLNNTQHYKIQNDQLILINN